MLMMSKSTEIFVDSMSEQTAAAGAKETIGFEEAFTLHHRTVFRAARSVVQDAGFKKFRVQREHLDIWKAEKAKDPGKGFGVDIAGVWYWYQSWIDRCIELCKAAGDKYKTATA